MPGGTILKTAQTEMDLMCLPVSRIRYPYSNEEAKFKFVQRLKLQFWIQASKKKKKKKGFCVTLKMPGHTILKTTQAEMDLMCLPISRICHPYSNEEAKFKFVQRLKLLFLIQLSKKKRKVFVWF